MVAIIEFKGNNIYVEQDGSILYKGEREMNNNEVYFYLKDKENRSIITVNQYKGFFKSTYDIITYKKTRKSLDLIPKSLLKGTWAINDDTDIYDIISHKGTKLSIFKNDQQIASIVEKIISLFNTKKIALNYNKSENLDLLIGIALAIYGDFYNYSGATLTINFGHIGPEMKKFDPNWIPNDYSL